MGKFNIHPIYLSMHCSIAILFSFYILRELRSKIKIAALLGIDITLVLFLLFYAKKVPLIAFIIVFSVIIVGIVIIISWFTQTAPASMKTATMVGEIVSTSSSWTKTTTTTKNVIFSFSSYIIKKIKNTHTHKRIYK